MSKLTDLVPAPSNTSVNGAASPCPTSFLIRKFGLPRKVLGPDCRPATSREWGKRLVIESVGPFRVTGHKLAVKLLRASLTALKAEHPDVYAALGTAGMFCCRFVRGSKVTPSNHSFGLAIDFTLNGVLDRRGDDYVQRGLLDLYSVMKRFGWFWGVEFGTEDAMHFEVSAEVVMMWIRSGEF